MHLSVCNCVMKNLLLNCVAVLRAVMKYTVCNATNIGADQITNNKSSEELSSYFYGVRNAGAFVIFLSFVCKDITWEYITATAFAGVACMRATGKANFLHLVHGIEAVSYALHGNIRTNALIYYWLTFSY